MQTILFIKTSSLGDIVHHMPAVTEARRHLPDARFAWVIEEAFAPLAALHPAVDEVVVVSIRRWRRRLIYPSTWREAFRFISKLRASTYDAIIDTQGLFRTAVIARVARGRRHGRNSKGRPDQGAGLFYDVRHAVALNRHAVERYRLLTGLALGYTPEGAPDYGLDRARLRTANEPPYALLVHSTARSEKEWPEEHWISLARALDTRGIDLILPWGDESERVRSDRIAARISRGQVPTRRPLDEMAKLVAGASFVIGVDTGLLHLAAALGVPVVAIFIGSEPSLFGPTGSGPMRIVGGGGAMPAVADVVAALETIGH